MMRVVDPNKVRVWLTRSLDITRTANRVAHVGCTRLMAMIGNQTIGIEMEWMSHWCLRG